MKRLRILISAYACEPGKGSEPGVGWNVVMQMAKYHEIWVITRANNRHQIEEEVPNNSIKTLQFVYYDLPSWARCWKNGARGIQLYYYLWQVGTYLVARQLNAALKFDLAHHVTFVKYSSPSLLSLLPIPFIWGPVGGAESIPKSFFYDLSFSGKAYEITRGIARLVGKFDPLVRATARNSRLSIATTEETGACLKGLGSKAIAIIGESGLSESDIDRLSRLPKQSGIHIRFISMGRLIHWKGFHLGIRAFAKANIPNGEYWILGEGKERERLETLVTALGISERVRFWGLLPRNLTLQKLGECHVLVHPSLHDSGGWVCLEAMAAGKPVICLDLGGPGTQVTNETGFKISAGNPKQAIHDMAKAMGLLCNDRKLLERMGKAGQERVSREYSWERKGEVLNSLYLDIARHSLTHS
jgi:glycosyltransferase involved in cell wall biosynthesis